MILRKHVSWTIPLSIFAMAILGCGREGLPELGYVEGTVTMDGEPLEGVLVRCRPVEGGRAGVGKTDEDGWYELEYVGGYEGSVLGPVKISIETEWPEGEPPDGVTEPIPMRYNRKSELTRTVEPGNNEFNFDLTSD